MLMPSEIARLVLGYLKDAGCTQAVNVYLTENVHLSEYVACLKQGHEYPTTIAGQSLTDILQDHFKLKAAGQIPQEMGQIIDNIQENLAQIKCLASSGHIENTPAIASISSQEVAEKLSVHPVLMEIVQEDVQTTNNTQNDSTQPTGQSSSSAGFISAAMDTADASESRLRVEQKKAMVDSSTQYSEDPQPSASITGVPTLRADDILESASQASASSSTQTPTRYALCSWSTTPSRRQVDFYSSPSSVVKSAMLYNFDIDAFRTPAKDRYPTDTPLRDRYLDDDGTWKSPRRKNQVPRKRLSYTPLSAAKTNVSVNPTPGSGEGEGHSNDNIDVSILIKKLIRNEMLPEKIADNINKVVNHTTQATVINDPAAKKQVMCNANEKVQQQDLPNAIETEQNEQVSVQSPTQLMFDDQMIQAAINLTESDPTFEDILNKFYDKQFGISRDSQILEACSDYAASPDTHGTPLNAGESTVPSSINCTPRSEIAETPKTVVMSPIVEIVQEPPDSSGITVASSNEVYCQTPSSEISSHCPSSTDHNVTPLSKETLQTVSNQSVTYSQRITYLPPKSDAITALPIVTAANSSLALAQSQPSSVVQNVSQLQYTSAPTMSSIPTNTLPYFSNIVPALNQSNLPTIFFPFYSNTGTIIRPLMTTLPVSSPSGQPACATLQNENTSVAPVQYFQLNVQGQNASEVTSQLNQKSFTEVIGQFHSPSKSSTTIKIASSGKNSQKRVKNVARGKSDKMPEKVNTYQVPQASSFVEVTTDIVNISSTNVSQDCSSSLPEVNVASSAPAITLYGQDMQEHRIDNLDFQKLLSNTSLSVAGKFISLTPAKSSSSMQFITLSPGSIMPLANTTGVPANSQTLTASTNNSKPDHIQCSSANPRANILRQRSTKFRTVNRETVETGNNSSNETIKWAAGKTTGYQKTVLKPLNFDEHKPVQKPARQPQMQLVDGKTIVTRAKSGSIISQQTSDKAQKLKSPDRHIITISNGIPRSMPVLENVRIINTKLGLCCTGSNEKSPQLTSLIQSASLLKASQQGQVRDQAASHVRTLDFGGPSNPAGEEDSQKTIPLNSKMCNTKSKSKDANTMKKPRAKSKEKKDIVKNCQKLKEKTKSDIGPCKKVTHTLSESEEESGILEITPVKGASSSPHSKKRTASRANLKNPRMPAKKSKGTAPGKVLSVMDIEKFLSGLQYEQ